MHSFGGICPSLFPFLLQERGTSEPKRVQKWGGRGRDGEEGAEMGRRGQRWGGGGRDGEEGAEMGRRGQRWGGGGRDGEEGAEMGRRGRVGGTLIPLLRTWQCTHE